MTPRHMMLAVLLGALSACGPDAPPPAPDPADARAESFAPGEWEVTAVTEKVQAKDQFAPATSEKVGKSTVRKVCSPPGKVPAFALFADQGGDCTAYDSYAKRGRLNMTFACQRPGHGPINISLDGDFTADSFEAGVIAATSFAGQGDYALTQKVTGKRLGDCPAGSTAPTAG